MDEKGLTTRADWLTACRRATDTMRTMLADRATTAERAVETGTTGGGGDRTLEIDDEAETIVRSKEAMALVTFGMLNASASAGNARGNKS